jgi:hypothetical protein
MFACKPTPATKTGRMSAAALGMFLCASAHTTPAAGGDYADAARAPLYGYFPEARGGGAPYQPLARSAAGAPADASPSDFLARLHYAFGSYLGLLSERAPQGEREVVLRNSDALVRAKVRLTLGKEWLGFVYADMGAVDSAVKWQGLAGVGGHGVELLGGWRHVTYHFSPDRGFDSLDFNGPFLGATLAW